VKEFTKQKPARKIKYVSFPLEPSKEDTLAASKKISRIQQSLAEALTPEAKIAAFDQCFCSTCLLNWLRQDIFKHFAGTCLFCEYVF